MDKWNKVAQDAWQAVLAGVQALKREGKTLDEIARILGVKNRALIGEWLNKNREAANAPFPNMLRYLEALGYSAQDFLPPPTIKRVAPNAPEETIPHAEGLPSIPVVAHAGAGHEIDFFLSEPERMLQILPSYFHPNMRAVQVNGDSMEPTIHKDSCVGVIPAHGQLEEGHIYLVNRPPFGLVVKRVFQGESNGIILRSDNPRWPDQYISCEDLEGIIIGKVIWVLQKV
ncbi:helix-turn-helix transcriptional regulator [Nitratidesulfovibrio sp. SRB-5]|uniref:LexA family transcriptional regulator n=1 Tax=Nitratidesulfovibrio sp. SRB-5 TaxID=2872636 RepID=UPI001026E8EC|nr:LexA family transcriptional regulator [Nitratidesulfovibrio sp. SRB-5]MBZ2172165.1 LexA family transcriptional regulator [Nitratidesulfovibrio sp. SRB-5]RXF77359.1 hypothetical protein EKK70_06835 [Desulfovibrio sp. DS-1]